MNPSSKPAVSRDRLHEWAAYQEQSIVFGQHIEATQRQMETELRGNWQRLSRADIWRVAQRLLAGSPYSISQGELEALDALQVQKDLYGIVRAIVLAAHQRTGALTGRIGVHTRIAAETDANAATNTEAVMRVLARVQPGNRILLMDSVKAVADEGQLRAPDIFETGTYGQLRNGLIENHAWNLQRLVRAIRDRGYQNRVLLIIRLDGPDGGANVNPFNPGSLLKYQLAIPKLIRYLETSLPLTPFKIVLGNEPDLPQERQWSDAQAEPRAFIFNQFAPATGAFMKKVARSRPDVTFLCPALSANMKLDHLTYYAAFFGPERPENLVPAMHGYSADVATMPAGQRNLVEQQAELLKVAGKFRHVSGTEIGSGNPFGDVDNLSERADFDDVVAWLLLSKEHRAPPGQDNHWNFQISPSGNDPMADHLADVVNRSKSRVLRNIRERDGAGLQILRNQPVDRPAYGVEYISHNTPTLLTAGQTNAVSMTLRNTSYQTWAAGGPFPVRLGYHWHTADGREVASTLWDDHRTPLPYDLLPGQSATLNCNLSAPRVPGVYELRWDLVEEQRTWFAWQNVPTLNVKATVNTDQGPVPPPSPAKISLSASHNNQQQGEDNLQQALDPNAYTRWSSRQPQQPGMWVQIDLGEARIVSQVRLGNDPSPRDYPRGYMVKLSLDRQTWTTVAENPLNNGALNVTFPPRQARYIKIDQTGRDAIFWWSVYEIGITSEIKMSARASHNNVLVGADNVAQAVDGRPETRWSSRAIQQPGMWFEVDLNQTRTVRGLMLDSARSPTDYPGGYVVRVSTDRAHWEEVARQAQNSRPLDITFSPRPARYLRVEQTGSSDRWWWSIHGVMIKE